MAFDFNGSTDRIDYDSVFSPRSTGITVAAWVYFDALSNISYVWASHVDDNSAYVAIMYVDTAGALLFQMMNATPAGVLSVSTASSRVATGQWLHLAASYDNSWNANGGKLYVNGVELSSGRSLNSTSTITGGGKWCIGGRYYDDARNVNGRIAEVGVWKRALSADHIGSLAKGCSPKTFPYLLYFAPELIYHQRDSVSGKAGTLDGTTTAIHPRVILPEGA